MPVVRFAMWGKTEQVRTSGKNLLDIKGETTFSKGTFEIKDNLIDCTLADTWGSSYIMFSKEYPAGEYTFSADKMKNGAVQKMSILLTVEPLSYSSNSCVFNDYYKRYLIKNGNTLSREITFKVDSPFGIGIPFSGDIDAVGETLSVKNIQLERGASATAYEPYTGGFPSPSPDWEQPIEITDQPVTVTVKGGTEQQSITLSPPKPMTKWDKLEKVDGVWCWVYQTKKYTVTGEEVFAKGGDSYVQGSSTSFYTTKDIGDPVGADSSLMNRLTKNERVWSKPGEIGYTLNVNQLHMRFLNTTLGVSDDATEVEKKTAYANYLKAEYAKGTPYELLYAVKESKLIPLSPSEQAQLNALTMYAGTTEVTNTGGCNMELTYTVDTKSYVDSKIAAISAAVLEV